ncbi:MAG: glycosyltransferase [Myxococcaceae bacterium]|nr:glycosyltransferase [Myxococcaceae bacterium]MCA3010919.1 glycosyltransferase [Myxococcaceae bacterium]
MKQRRIWYGVAGAGLGHTMRAAVIARHLERRGHRVRLVSSGRAVEVLRRHGLCCDRVEGLDFHFDGGRVRPWRSLADVLRGGGGKLRRNGAVCARVLREFRPDAVLTDFESLSSLVGALAGLPVVSVDHQHVIDRCRHPRRVRDAVPSFAALRALCALRTRAHRYVVTSFFFPEPMRADTTLVGPVLRPAWDDLEPRAGRHVVVYHTSASDLRLLPTLRRFTGTRFLVYGLGREGVEGHVECRRFDERGFAAALASARAVITNGGFTTIGEALALGKPVLSIPVDGQPEQALNAQWLAALGAGVTARALSADRLDAFLSTAFPRLADARLHTGRRDACAAVDAALEAVS